MLTQENKLELVGLATLGIQERDKLRRTEAAICGVLKRHGVNESDADSWAGELIYNEGDDPVMAVDRVLGILELEVEPE
jgi:hypothetical protein